MDTYLAYEALGLTPLDEHLKGTVGNRNIGATTWMLVEAALAVIRGESVVLVGRDIPHAEALARDCKVFLEKLGYPIYKGGERHIASMNGHLYWESHSTIVGFRRGKPDIKEYRDHLWKKHAQNRREGPYQCIWRFDRVPHTGDFDAYDHRGEFLMRMPKDAMWDHVREHPEVEVNERDHP